MDATRAHVYSVFVFETEPKVHWVPRGFFSRLERALNWTKKRNVMTGVPDH